MIQVPLLQFVFLNNRYKLCFRKSFFEGMVLPVLPVIERKKDFLNIQKLVEGMLLSGPGMSVSFFIVTCLIRQIFLNTNVHINFILDILVLQISIQNFFF